MWEWAWFYGREREEGLANETLVDRAGRVGPGCGCSFFCLPNYMAADCPLPLPPPYRSPGRWRAVRHPYPRLACSPLSLRGL